MKLSWNWLKSVVDPGVSAEQYAADMTMAGQKVETVTYWGQDVQKVVTGNILSMEKHPDADRLSVCQIDAGGGTPLTIVTGAPNVKPGDCVPVALHGALLPGGKKIEKGKLRGVKSEGMLCSHQELGLTTHDLPYAPEDGVLVFPERHAPGSDVRPIVGLDDITIEFEITNNRPDCLSVLGLARETAAIYGRELKIDNGELNIEDAGASAPISIEVEDPELCPRYTAMMVTDVKIEPSPAWMRHRLRACGVRPINNIVDITNYVMLEYGQPMHAFDFACCGGEKIIVRRARPGETMTTLDGQPRKITEDMLMICDAHKPVGIAGVMGGENSEITEKTKQIIFESANFNGPSVRKTALVLNLRTDASGRFEKGLDMESTVPAVLRACELVAQLGAGSVKPFMIDIKSGTKEKHKIRLEPERINALLGTNLDREYMEKTLRLLGFEVDGNAVSVPSWRDDVEAAEDLAEEIARMYGYGNIPTALPVATVRGALTDRQQWRKRVTELCRALGYSEMLTYSFFGGSEYDKLRLAKDDKLRNSLCIVNPLGEDTSVMRTTMLPSLMRTLAVNSAARNDSAWVFELARVYIKTENQLPDEPDTLIMGAYGRDMDFYALKGACEAVFELMRIENVTYEAVSDNLSYHPGRCAAAKKGDKVIAVFGEVHPSVCEAYGVSRRAYAAEINFEEAYGLISEEKKYSALPRYPGVQRDLAVVCREDVTAAALTSAIQKGAGELLKTCKLFDVYTGKQVPENHKSAAFSLFFSASDRTLTDSEVDEAVSRALETLKTDCGAVIRG